MDDLEFFLDEDANVRFDVSAEGTKKASVNCRLVLEASKYMSLSFPGTRISNDAFNVALPSLKTVLDEGKYHVKLEVICDDRIYPAYEGNFVLKNSIKITAEAKIVSSTAKPTVTASIITESPVPSSHKQPHAEVIGNLKKPQKRNRINPRQAAKRKKSAGLAKVKPANNTAVIENRVQKTMNKAAGHKKSKKNAVSNREFMSRLRDLIK